MTLACAVTQPHRLHYCEASHSPHPFPWAHQLNPVTWRLEATLSQVGLLQGRDANTSAATLHLGSLSEFEEFPAMCVSMMVSTAYLK